MFRTRLQPGSRTCSRVITLSVLALVRVVVATEKRADVLRTLRSLMGPTQVQRGCISCHLYRDAGNENALTYVEYWNCRDALDRHMRSDQYRKLLAVIDESVEPPEIRFDTVSETEGIAAIWSARGVAATR